MGPKTLDECELLPREAFFSKHTEMEIMNKEYAHAHLVWNTFGCRSMRDYHNVYVMSDVMLLANVFEEFRLVSHTQYKLDPCHFFTTPCFSLHAALKLTGVKIGL